MTAGRRRDASKTGKTRQGNHINYSERGAEGDIIYQCAAWPAVKDESIHCFKRGNRWITLQIKLPIKQYMNTR